LLLQASAVFIPPLETILLTSIAVAFHVVFLKPPESPSALWSIKKRRRVLSSSVVQWARSLVALVDIGHEKPTERRGKQARER
jgi:hypothetical protein